MNFTERQGNKLKKSDIKDILKEFGVKDENELYLKLMDEALVFECSVCGKKYDVDFVKFIGDKVICVNCLEKKNEDY
jgi:Ca2+-binding EF-hand superfamily protein